MLSLKGAPAVSKGIEHKPEVGSVEGACVIPWKIMVKNIIVDLLSHAGAKLAESPAVAKEPVERIAPGQGGGILVRLHISQLQKLLLPVPVT